MNITNKKVDTLTPYKLNAKKHPQAQIEGIAESIKRFGFIQPVVIDGKSEIIIGHGRVEAAKLLGLKEVPTVICDELTPQEVKALRILDNKLNESEWDEELLTLDLEELDFDFAPFNIDLPEPTPETSEDDFESPPIDEIKTDIKLGDIIELGRHRVMCGDNAILNFKINFDWMITDPPYGINMDKGFEGFGGFGKPIARRQYTDKWDGERPPPEILLSWIDRAKNSIIFGGNFFADQLPQGKHWIVWDKQNTMPTFGDCELAWTNIGRNSVKKFEIVYNGLIGKEEERFHPTQKPVTLFVEIIKEYTDASNTVADPFLGSGTTLIACEQLNRTCYGMEIEPKYCQVIINRFEKYCLDNDKPFECKINGNPYKKPATEFAAAA